MSVRVCVLCSLGVDHSYIHTLEIKLVACKPVMILMTKTPDQTPQWVSEARLYASVCFASLKSIIHTLEIKLASCKPVMILIPPLPRGAALVQQSERAITLDGRRPSALPNTRRFFSLAMTCRFPTANPSLSLRRHVTGSRDL